METYSTLASGVPTAQSSLSRLQEQLAHAAGRVNSVAMQLREIGHNIHGPRPQEVSAPEKIQGKQPESISGRLNALLEEIGTLETAAAQLVR